MAAGRLSSLRRGTATRRSCGCCSRPGRTRRREASLSSMGGQGGRARISIGAAVNGREAVVRLLLEAGADKEAKNNYGRTPLIIAAQKGREAVVRLLLEAGADKEAKSNDGNTPLIRRRSNGHEAVVPLLLEAGADKEAKE